MKFDAAAFAKYYFDGPSADPKKSGINSIWKCKNCKKPYSCNVQTSGKSNLLSHLVSCLKKDKDEILRHFEENHSAGIKTSVFTVTNEQSDTFALMEWIVMRDHCLSEVDNLYTRGVLRFKNIMCAKTLRKYIMATATILKDKVKKDLPTKVVGIFDGWTEGDIHYIGFAVAYLDGKGDYQELFISMKPILTDGVEDLTARSHANHISSVLAQYGLSVTNLVALVGDNCSVNRRLCSDLKIPLIGCAAHKLNLAVNLWIDSQGEDKYLRTAIQSLHNLMTKASTIKNAAQLRKFTGLHAVTNNATRWSSVFDMITRYSCIKGDLERVDSLIPYLLTPQQNTALFNAVPHLEVFNESSLLLQEKGVSFVRARNIFDVLLSMYPSMGHHLGTDASIIHDKAFERALWKIHSDLPLHEDESKKVQHLLLVQPSQDNNGPTQPTNRLANLPPTEGAIEQLKKRLRTIGSRESKLAAKYIDLKVITGTSVSLERSFSAAKHILTDTRKRTAPALFEALLFLKLNHGHWDARLVATAVDGLKEKARMQTIPAVVHELDLDDDDDDDDDVMVNDTSDDSGSDN
jgi:hypothetical protein